MMLQSTHLRNVEESFKEPVLRSRQDKMVVQPFLFSGLFWRKVSQI